MLPLKVISRALTRGQEISRNALKKSKDPLRNTHQSFASSHCREETAHHSCHGRQGEDDHLHGIALKNALKLHKNCVQVPAVSKS